MNSTAQVKHEIGIDLLYATIGLPNISYEIMPRGRFGANLQIGFNQREGSLLIRSDTIGVNLDDIYNYGIREFLFTIQAKHYFSKDKHKNLWLGAYWYNEIELSRDESFYENYKNEFGRNPEIDTWQYSVLGFDVGYKFLFKFKMFIELRIGVGTDLIDLVQEELFAFRPRMGIITGYRF